MTPKEKEEQKAFMRQVLASTGLTIEAVAERLGREVKTAKKMLWADIKLTDSNRRELQRLLENYTNGRPIFGVDRPIFGGDPRTKLASALAIRHLTTSQLAKLIRYDAGVIENVINGTGKASEKMIEAIVREIPELTKEELMGGADQPPTVSEDGMHGTHGAKPTISLPAGTSGRMVPLLSMAQAGGWGAGHSDEGWNGDSVFAMNVDDRRAFAIKVSGNSMDSGEGKDSDIYEGDVVICSPRQQITNGCAAVVRTRSEQVFVKFWKQKGDTVTLESSNPDYPPIPLPVAEIAGAWPVVQRIKSGLIKKH